MADEVKLPLAKVATHSATQADSPVLDGLGGEQFIPTWSEREALQKLREHPEPKPAAVALTPEDRTILEVLAQEHPMTVTQEGLAGATRLSDRTVREHLKYLRKKKLINRPRGPKKGEGITALGLSVIGHE